MLPRKLQFSYLALAIPMLFAGPPAIQSGRGLMHGYVAFEDISYNEVTQGAIHAKVELRGNTKNNSALYTAETNERGAYDIPSIGAGEYTLTISAPGHASYRIDVLIPSDFECRLATMLRKKSGARP
ncbi:MAG: carboxypeptidase-like regulatory domain-containing protein [bacterium]